jgi:hypothetical protein
MPFDLQGLFLIYEYIKIKYYGSGCGDHMLQVNNGIVFIPEKREFQLGGGMKMVSRS